MALHVYERNLLKIARTLIDSGHDHFVCHAILNARRMKMGIFDTQVRDNYARAADRLIRYIEESLGCACLDVWQEKHGFNHAIRAARGMATNARHRVLVEYDTRLRADRVAWIDWMLEEPK